jgi:hypothetical protein
MKVSESGYSLAVERLKGGGGGGEEEAAPVQMNGYAPCTEVIYSQDTADNIPAHFIEHQDLPDRVAIFVQDRGGMRDKTARSGLVNGVVFNGLRIMVQVQ